MGYESLSTIIVLVIAVIVIAVWLPARTVNGMKRAAEHRQDRYSPSLRIVQAEDGRRFGDVKPRDVKGAVMPGSTTSAKLTPAHIAHVRELRKQSIKRRQILVGVLLAVTVLVLVLAFALHFSPLFALIPFALTVVVLALGANAARHAREWEHKVRRYEQSRKRAARQLTQREQQSKAQVAAAADSAEVSPSPAQEAHDASDSVSTEVMEQRQIRRALRAAEIEQAKAKALREAAAKAQAESEAAKNDQSTAEAQDATVADAQESANTTASGANTAAQSVQSASDQSAARVKPSLTVRDERDQEAADATSELVTVKPAHALDVFDMATSQDLISFSLGEPRNEGNAPESLEIKSTRQVAKAEPVEPEAQQQLIDEARAVKAADDAEAAAKEAAKGGAKAEAQAEASVQTADSEDNQGQQDASKTAAEAQESFREREEHAEVEAPAATSESLSAGLDSILARRGN
ncbi:hypothetical protein JS530_00080 [Bifidobacterium sp. LC6]|uniref:Magnesium transporter n=1 Tax=Bifidobacterium colobi TaxID=2809026 RepID=A0ABS5USH1_9BIFI|nr:hypothetical protein [Bifidobacterium colobi]MBT1173932.1 hypothetical protein [Bifidobacterium colobi]